MFSVYRSDGDKECIVYVEGNGLSFIYAVVSVVIMLCSIAY